MKTKEFSELSKLTLVMATYSRQEHVKRNMAYWSNTGVILLVLDASPKPIENEILKTFDDNIIYVHDTSDYNERLVNSFSKIPPINILLSSIAATLKNSSLIPPKFIKFNIVPSDFDSNANKSKPPLL